MLKDAQTFYGKYAYAQTFYGKNDKTNHMFPNFPKCSSQNKGEITSGPTDINQHINYASAPLVYGLLKTAAQRRSYCKWIHGVSRGIKQVCCSPPLIIVSSGGCSCKARLPGEWHLWQTKPQKQTINEMIAPQSGNVRLPNEQHAGPPVVDGKQCLTLIKRYCKSK